MKRNILLLTAVVLAAVLMTGCILPFMGIKVSYDLEKDVFKEDKLVTKVKKGDLFEPEFKFAKDDAEYDKGDFEVTVVAGETEFEDLIIENIEVGEKVVGIKVLIKDVGKKDIKISVKFPALVEDGE